MPALSLEAMARGGDAGLRRRRRVRAWTIAEQPIDDAERGEIIFEHTDLLGALDAEADEEQEDEPLES